MSSPRIVALIIGCLMLVPGLGLLFGGGALGLAYAAGRNESGYFQASLTDLRTDTEAITAQTPVLTTDVQPSCAVDELGGSEVPVSVGRPGWRQ